jgi:hypothetical protein
MLIGHTGNFKYQEDYLYVITSKTKYVTCIDRVDNIEDVDGDFYTYDEIQSITGGYCTAYGAHFHHETFKNDLAALVSKMNADGKKSIVIDDEDILDCFTTGIAGNISQYVPGTRRIGNKIVLQESKKTTKPNKKLLRTLVDIATWKIIRKYNVEFKQINIHSSYSGTINMIKRLIDWEDVFSLPEQKAITMFETWVVEKIRSLTEDELVAFKYIWDNPTMFDKDEDKG